MPTTRPARDPGGSAGTGPPGRRRGPVAHVNFTRTVEIGWHQVAHVDVQLTSLATGRMQILTIDRVGAPPVPAVGVLRMWSGILGPGSAQMSVARQVWGRWVAERERAGAPKPGPTTTER